MDFESACKWLSAADVIESQETLHAFKTNDWPYIEKHERQQIHKTLHKRAYPFEWDNAAPLSLQDAAQKLAGLKIPKGKGK